MMMTSYAALGSGERHCSGQFRWPEMALRASDRRENRFTSRLKQKPPVLPSSTGLPAIDRVRYCLSHAMKGTLRAGTGEEGDFRWIWG
jgi:hypothetical protein